MSIAVSVLPELGISTLADLSGTVRLLEAMSFSARVQDGDGATVVLRDHQVDIEGELDSTTRQLIRDAVLFGSGNRMVRVYPGDIGSPSGPHGSPSGPHGSPSGPHGEHGETSAKLDR